VNVTTALHSLQHRAMVRCPKKPVAKVECFVEIQGAVFDA
jgi:hypothetical protein